MVYIKGKNLITTDEYVTCPYCGDNSEQWRYLHWRHLKLKHNKTLEDVRNEFPNHPTMTKSFDDDRIKGSQKTAQTHNQLKNIKCIYCECEIKVPKNTSNFQACKECLSKGFENPDGRTKPEAQNNRIKTFQKKYGVSNPQQVKEFSEKASQTFDSKHGGRGFASKKLAKKTQKTIKEKYGADNIMQSKEGMYKFLAALKLKYGKDITNAYDILEVREKTRKKLIEFYKQKDHHTKGKTYNEMYGEEASKKLIELRRESGAKGYEMAPKTSAPQLELYELVKKLFPEAKLEFGQNLKYDDERYYYFLDIAIPELKICIEYDGSFWHNEEKDKFRDEVLESFGWKIIRYVDVVPSKEELENDINKLL